MIGGASHVTAHVHADDPGSRTCSDEDQSGDLLVDLKRPEPTEHDGHGGRHRQPGPVPCQISSFPRHPRIWGDRTIAWVSALHPSRPAYHDPMRARMTAITATTPIPNESTRGIGERGSGSPLSIARWFAFQCRKLVN